MMRTIALTMLCLAQLSAAGVSHAQNRGDRMISLSDGDPATYEWTGAYVNGGLSVGFPNEVKGGLDLDPGAAVAFGGGYRFNRWLAAEMEFNVTAGSDVKRSDDDLVIFAFTINSKTYPMANSTLLPEWVQPFFGFGFGGGVVDAGDVLDESSFMMRFNVGSEFMFWDHFGLYTYGGYMLADDGETALDGTGQWVMGGLYRF